MNIGLCFGGYEENIAGVNRVILEAVKEILKIDTQNHYISLEENYLNFPIPVQDLERFQKIKMKSSYNYRDIACYLDKIDVIHSYYNPFAHYNYNCKKIFTVHDIIPVIHPEWFNRGDDCSFDMGVRKCVQIADVIMTVSQSTKNDVVKYYEVPEEKVQVIYPGVYSKLNFEIVSGEVIEKYGLRDGYILSVCTLEPRKNLRGLIRGFELFKRFHPTSCLKLVLTGKLGWDNDFKNFVSDLGIIAEDLVLTGYVTAEELSDLYAQAHAVAYVSFYEGFGLPILEAMAAGKAVITSATSSMPEVGGDAVLYCDPYETESISYAIERIALNETLRLKLEEKAKKRAEMFSYHKMAEEILDLYKKLG